MQQISFFSDRNPLDVSIDEDQIEDEGGEMNRDEGGSGGDKNAECSDEEMQGMSLDEDLDSEGRGNNEFGGDGGHDNEDGGDDELKSMTWIWMPAVEALVTKRAEETKKMTRKMTMGIKWW